MTALEKLYGENISLAQLRTHFFTCRQQADEGVGVRLRECLSRWRAKEPGAAQSDAEMLKSQLVLGLRPGPVQTEIQRLLRRESGLSFQNIYKEAKAVEREHRTPLEEPGACHAYAAPVMTRPPPQERPLTDWKDRKSVV